MAGSPYPASKVSTLDRLINLDYVNQYEKILRPLPLGPRGLGRTRGFPGDALRLCQPRADPLRAVAGFAQPSLSRRGRPGIEGAAGGGPRPAPPAGLLLPASRGGFGGRGPHPGTAAPPPPPCPCPRRQT